mgnify:CR=1 FL=1
MVILFQVKIFDLLYELIKLFETWSIHKILNDFKKIWYNVEWKILNSSDYWVPQNRKRVIIIGVRNDLPYTYKFPSNICVDKKTVRDAIWDLPIEYSSTIPNHHGSKHKVKINGYLWNRHIDWDKPAPTITWRWWWTGWPIIMPHPSQERRMTVREYARLQSFPDDFIFQWSISSQYRQIWNAVPPLMWFEIWKQFHTLKLEEENKKISKNAIQVELFQLQWQELLFTH